MSKKELIQAELDNLGEEDLETLYVVVKRFVQSRQPEKPTGLLAALRSIQIDAPADFASNFDRYADGKNFDESDLR